jgi:hypothetical protein
LSAFDWLTRYHQIADVVAIIGTCDVVFGTFATLIRGTHMKESWILKKRQPQINYFLYQTQTGF